MELAGDKLLRIEYIPLGRVAKWDKNPKKHDLPRLMSSIKRYGFRDAVIFDGTLGALVAGHGRAAALEALRNQGDPPPFGVATDNTGAWYLPVQFGNDAPSRAVAEAFALDHNNLTLSGSGLDSSLLWDSAAYADVLRTLSEGFELPETVSADEAGRLLGLNGKPKDVEPQIDKAAELAVKWGTALGQVWQLGNHRLACGDCTDGAVVEAVMRGERAAITFTSPPYNAGSLNILGNVPTLPKYRNDTDKKSYTEYLELLFGFTDLALSICDEVFMNIGLVEDNKRAIISYLIHYIEAFKDFIYWKKHTVAPHIQEGVINNLVEFVICLGDGRRKFKYAQFGQGTYWNVIEGPNASSNEYAQIHKATFPLYFPAEIINNFSPSGAIVYEPFSGSGTTLIACENLGRKCRAIELDPGYIAVALQRWADLTKQEPHLV